MMIIKSIIFLNKVLCRYYLFHFFCLSIFLSLTVDHHLKSSCNACRRLFIGYSIKISVKLFGISSSGKFSVVSWNSLPNCNCCSYMLLNVSDFIFSMRLLWCLTGIRGSWMSITKIVRNLVWTTVSTNGMLLGRKSKQLRSKRNKCAFM